MEDPEELPRPERIPWDMLRPPIYWHGTELLKEIVDPDKLRRIVVLQLDHQIDSMRREIEHMENIRDIIAKE